MLSQGDYAGFHTLLESLIVGEDQEGKGKGVESDPFIRYPVELERSLMEGSYDQVWRKTNGRDVPGEEFGLFSEVCNPIRVGSTGLMEVDPNQYDSKRDRKLCCEVVS